MKLKIQTVNPVDINTNLLNSVNDTLEGRLINVAWAEDNASLVATAFYYYIDGNGDEVALTVVNETLDEATINATAGVITLDPNASKSEQELELFYKAFIKIAATTYSMQENDWQLMKWNDQSEDWELF